MRRSAVVTGATGLLGSWVVCALLRSGRYDRVYAIVRGASKKSAKSRVINILNFIPHRLKPHILEKLRVAKGDVLLPNLGLSFGDLKLLRDKAVDIFHAAAVADFNMTLAQIRPTNVMGTRNVFKMALALKQQQMDAPIRVHHISTIAIAGNTKGWFNENQFNVGQKFNNTYEQSKYEAEKIAREYYRHNLVVKIYRPSIIVGDSRCGVTTNFKMIYQPLHFMVHNLFKELPANKACLHSFVPVDRVADAISILSEYDFFGNNVYHLVNPDEISLGRFIETASRVLKFKRPSLIPLKEFQRDRLSKAQWKLIDPFVPYFNYRLRFRKSITTNLLGSFGFHWPKINDSLLQKLYKFCIKSNFVPLG